MRKHLVLSCLILATVTVFGQDAAKRPVFDSASLKVSKNTQGNNSESSAGYLRINGTLKGLVREAYNIDLKQIEGGPKWLDDDRYEIEARADHPADYPELRLMMQSLLADRFKLALHLESRTVSGYALVVAKGGPKVAALPECADGHSTNGRDGMLVAKNETFSDFVIRLARQMNAPVVDETGNKDCFNFTLKWDPSDATGTPSAGTASTPGEGGSIFTALQEQLGIRLETRKVPTDILVIDRAEKPILP